MDSLFDDLRRAREAKRLSIVDVSDATLINVSFLEAIEQGKTDILPQTYVRAFIREYASFVGLDPVEAMKRYDLAQQKTESQHEEPPQPPPTPRPEPSDSPEPTTAPNIPTMLLGKKVIVPVVFSLLVVVIIWNLLRTTSPVEVKETPIQPGEQTATASHDSLEQKHAAERHPLPVAADSLTLHAKALDSVWVEVTIDSQQPRQYIFAPNRKIAWRAKDHFRVNVGNAGVIEFTLNDKSLGAPGKRGVVLRNIEFTRQTLQKK